MLIEIKKEGTGIRADLWLQKNFLQDLSRSKVQKLIKSGGMLINEKIIASHYILKLNDKVEIKSVEKINAIGSPEKHSEKISRPKLKLIKETKDYLIINKPAGLIVHESGREEKNNLVELLLKKYPSLVKVGENPERPAIVHRLDRDASGLMVIPKNQAMFDYMKKEFQERRVKKEYVALVYGKLSKEEDIIKFPIDRSQGGYKMAAHPVLNKGEENEAGKRAITEFEVVQRYVNYTLIKLRTKTGRTHQIRVHMSAYGHPLVGDDLYGTARTKIQNKKLNLGRIFLVAKKLSFADMSGERKQFKIEMPEELLELLKKIK